MISEADSFASGEKRIYTLAESGTQKADKRTSIALVSGDGTDITNNSSLAKRAKRKLITRNMTLALIDVSREKGDPEMEKALWNAYYCLNNVIISNDKMYGKYCKNRFCTVCNAIRKADTINRYFPVISQWPDVHFVTLTVKACKEYQLNRWVDRMFKAFDRIHNRCKKRHQRGKGIKLEGIKSLECNFNPQAKTYNPHYHIIVPNRQIAELLVEEWLIQWKPIKPSHENKYTNPKAQKISKVTNLELSLIETIKYGSKIFTEPDLKKKARQKGTRMIYARALYNILVAMKGKRIFERFGFNLPKQPSKGCTRKLIENYETWLFPKDGSDWINPETGETLTGFIQSSELAYLLSECININDS